MRKLLTALARKQPDLQYASWGNGSSGHCCGELMKQKTQMRLDHIPYKSVAQIQTDLLGGHIPLGFVDMASGMPMVKAGRVKAQALCTSNSAALPGVRSCEDDGISDAGQGDHHARSADGQGRDLHRCVA